MSEEKSMPSLDEIGQKYKCVIHDRYSSGNKMYCEKSDHGYSFDTCKNICTEQYIFAGIPFQLPI